MLKQISVCNFENYDETKIFQFCLKAINAGHDPLCKAWLQGSWGQHGAHLGRTGPRWAPCWHQETLLSGKVSIVWLVHCVGLESAYWPYSEITCLAGWLSTMKSLWTYSQIDGQHIFSEYTHEMFFWIISCSLANTQTRNCRSVIY